MNLPAPEKVFGAALPCSPNSTINKFILVLFMSVCFVLSGTAQTPIPNPDLVTDQVCDQFRVIMVLDESGSIDDGPNGSVNEQSVRDAAVALANGLSNSGAQLALVEFSSSATVSTIGGVSGFQTVDNAYVGQLSSYLTSNYSPDGCTNWGEAFDRVIGLNNTSLAQLVVFVTDGVPTIESDGFNSCGLFCADFCQEALNVAVNRSNQVKNQGSHIFVLGVGEAQNNAAEIQAISGPDQDTDAGVNPPSDPGFAQADYSLVPFSMLQPCLADIVNQSCFQVVNPDLDPLPCDELDVMIILDESGSIDDGPNGANHEQGMRNAAITLANSLSGSGANMSVVKFSNDAEIVNVPGFDPNWNPVGPSYTAALQSYLNSNYNAEGWTNWEDAFQKAIDLNAIRTADLIIFATDGNPTAYMNNGGGCVDCDESIGNICTDCESDNALDRATLNSDILKAAGSHLFGLAIGTEINLANISAVTGLDQDLAPGDAPGPDPGFNQADFSGLPFSDLVTCIADIASQSCDPCEGNIDFIDFDTDADGNPLAAGADPSLAYTSLGITITTSDATNNPPMIFDSANPTGDDADLGTPNQTAPAPGPGQGSGGEAGTLGENLEALGNVLIISEDGDASDPDDNGSGGSIFFNFDAPVDVTGVKILDTDFSEIGGMVIAKANDNSIIQQQEILAYGSNSVQTVLLNANDVSQLEVQFPSSGAVAQLILCSDETELASVGDLVYVDDDCDLINGNTQTGIAGVTLRLLDVDDNVIAETTTGPNGMYLFDNLIPGIYQVQIADGIPAMFASIADLDGNNDGSSGPFVLLPLQERTDVDFGYLSSEGCCDLEIECPNENGGSYQCLADVPQPNPNSIVIIDSCDTPVISVMEEVDGEGCTGDPLIVKYTYTVTDGAESETCEVSYTVMDSMDPVITCPADASYQCLSEVPDVDLGQVSAIDNCSDPVVTFEGESINGDECSGTITRTFRATDPCGNYAECTQTITYQDTMDPVLHGIPLDDEIDCQEMPGAPAMVTASDNCLMDIDVIFTEVFDDSECPKRYLRTWTATDNCGNFATHTQTIYVIDDAAPMINPFPVQVNVECDELDDLMVTAIDNCSNVTITYEDMHQSGGCLGMIIRTWIATDDCGNRSEAEQYIGLKDTTPPTIFGVGSDMNIDCESPIPAIPMVTAADNCELDLDLVFNQEIIQGNCPSNYQIVWTWTATDFCDNVTEETQTITVEDTTAPEFLEVPLNLALECDEVIPAPQTPLVLDNCSSYEVMFNEVMENGICPQSFVKYRTWTTTDACGNQSSYVQEIVVQDTSDPVIEDLDDITIQCDEALPTNLPSATDNCGVATVTELQEIITTDCAYEYTLIRTFTATDECGNTSESEQVVTVQDNEGPTLSDYPTGIVLNCEDDIPNPPVIIASDNCDANVQVTFEQNFIGEAPDPEAENDCVLLTPATENYNEDWGLILPGFEQGYEFYAVVEGRWRDYADGTARIEATFVSIDNDNAGWVADIYLENGLNWDDWSTQDFLTSYKDDFDEAGDEYLNWIYYIIRSEGSVLEGWGDFEGSSLSIEHAPSNFYYGYQVGIASNNVNSEFGSGGWFTYDGLFVDASTDFSAQVNGGGDFAFNHDCCLQYEVVWTWTATDCAGNLVSHSMNISFQDLEGTEDVEVRCVTDFDGDGTTNSRDLLLFLADFGCQENCGCDLNGDDRVDAADLLVFLSAFGQDCE